MGYPTAASDRPRVEAAENTAYCHMRLPVHYPPRVDIQVIAVNRYGVAGDQRCRTAPTG